MIFSLNPQPETANQGCRSLSDTCLSANHSPYTLSARACGVGRVCGKVQVAAAAQDFADILSAAVSCAAGLYVSALDARHHQRHSLAGAGAAVLRVGSACGDSECAGHARVVSRAAVEPGDPGADAVPGTILLRLDLPDGDAAALCGQHALGGQAG